MPYILVAASRGVPHFKADMMSFKNYVDHLALTYLYIFTTI
jgi:hypothetical protein